MRISTILIIAMTFGAVGTIIVSGNPSVAVENVDIVATTTPEIVSAAYVPAPLETCPANLPDRYADDVRAAGSLVVVFKSLYLLGVYEAGALSNENGKPVCFPVAMGAKPWGAKMAMDNQSTPEGWYTTATKQDKGQTSFYRAFRISYPNADDVARAFDAGVIDASAKRRLLADISAGRAPSQNTAMGGDIMIHGVGAWNPFWTAGCIALENESMDLLFRHVRKGETVLVTPWTERYSFAEDGTLFVSIMPMPVGTNAAITIPYDSVRADWQPGVRFARLEWAGRGSASVKPILASP